MNIMFEITGECTVLGADLKPKEQDIADMIKQLLEQVFGVQAIIHVSNMREENENV